MNRFKLICRIEFLAIPTEASQKKKNYMLGVTYFISQYTLSTAKAVVGIQHISKRL